MIRTPALGWVSVSFRKDWGGTRAAAAGQVFLVPREGTVTPTGASPGAHTKLSPKKASATQGLLLPDKVRVKGHTVPRCRCSHRKDLEKAGGGGREWH